MDTRADVHASEVRKLGFDFNNIVVHGKGYAVISALSLLLGDEVFDRIHGRCLQDFADRRMTFSDFQSVCELESRQDLDWFFGQWVSSSLYLAYGITTQDCVPLGTGYRSTVVVARRGTLDMPVPVTARFEDGTEQTVFTGRLRPVSTLRFDSAASLVEAVIDVDGELAMILPPPDPEEIKLRRFRADLDACG